MSGCYRCLCILFYLVISQNACSKGYGESVAGKECVGFNQSNERALSEYKQGHYYNAIRYSRTDCLSPDWQVIFNSYIVLYLSNQSITLKKNAKDHIAKFIRQPVWYADPGPLLVVLGDDDDALSWYQAALGRLHSVNSNSGASNVQKLVATKMYYEEACELIKSSDWKILKINQKLKKLTDSEVNAVKINMKRP